MQPLVDVVEVGTGRVVKTAIAADAASVMVMYQNKLAGRVWLEIRDRPVRVADLGELVVIETGVSDV